MDEPFFIPCRYKGVDREFTATFQAFGYTFRFHVDVDGTDVIFERDEEGNIRAIIPPDLQKSPTRPKPVTGNFRGDRTNHSPPEYIQIIN